MNLIMHLKKLIKDSFVVGIFAGIVSLVFFYSLLTAFRTWLLNYSGNEMLLRPPAVQMIAMAINLIIFRLIMINVQKEKTGKGFLLVTVLLSLCYFYFFYRANN